ncbi:MAG: glutaminyl-peptide cyclotransferase [Chloroflexi bacterium]|nr:glutaminyl-peptide cyclotransferase [Chloroflexota bacterium]
MRRAALLALCLLGVAWPSAGGPGAAYSPALADPGAAVGAPTYTFEVLRVFPHDPGAFTQGLVYASGVLYEGTGLWGQSTLRKVALESGAVLQQHRLPDECFGEGITLWGDQIIQLTWQSQRGFVYDRESFAPLREFTYPSEGWGLTHDGQHLIMSDGSATLRYWDPETFAEVRQVQVHDGQRPVERLNELEYVNGEILANVWLTDRIARISPTDGRVMGWIDLSGLLSQGGERNADVLNGIAYDAQGDRLFVTGKLWPKLFQIRVYRRHSVALPLLFKTVP